MQETFNTKVTFKSIKNDFNKSDSAIREAVANAIDANAKNIHIYLYGETVSNSLIETSIFCLDIADDGDGIPCDKEEFEMVFCRYKDSNKKDKFNYGKKGKGRYTYPLLPKNPNNVSIYTRENGDFFKINFNCKENETITINHKKFDEAVETKVNFKYKTLIQFKDLNPNKFETVKNDKIDEYISAIKNEVLTFFTDRIASESIKIYLNNQLLNIDNYLEQKVVSETIKIEDQESIISFDVDFYIWNRKVRLKADRQKHILFFDKNSSLKGITPSGKNKLAFNGSSFDHTVIVKSNYFNNRDFIGDNDIYNNLFTDRVIKNLRGQIALKLETILFNLYRKNINRVSDEYIHFLKLSKDELTQNVYHTLFLPFVEKFGAKKIPPNIKSIIAKLISTLASESPDSFIKNLETILNLTPEESRKIEYIQENYGIIKAITHKEKLIKRIDFLNNFDNLVNGSNRKAVKERTQLHQVIEKNLWLIDKRFEDIEHSDIFSDKALQTILEEDDFFQFDSEKLKDISIDYNIKKIPDIYIPIQKENIIYIIELKKPTVSINQKIIMEVMDKYVKTLKDINKRYDVNSQKKIHGIAISDSKRGDVYPIGNINSNGIEVEAKTWTELIEDTRSRYTEKIKDLDHKLKNSNWKDLEDFILS